MLEWFGIFLSGLFYAIFVLFASPLLMIFRFDQRGPTIDDGVDLGYDDNDPGKDVDE